MYRSKKNYIEWAANEEGKHYFIVHTEDDDHHLNEFDEDTKYLIQDWIRWNFHHAKQVYRHATSYGMKHILEHRTGIYMSNNQFKEAMLTAGFLPSCEADLNWMFSVKASSPALKPQADGNYGIPIIGSEKHYY